MVGSYKPHKPQSEEDNRVAVVAEFAVQTLLGNNNPQKPSSSTEDQVKPASLPHYSFLDVVTSSQDKLQVQVVKAYTQVVAGLNYRLVLLLAVDKTCIGAFTVQIYDHFGDLTVTHWGKELTCDDAKDLLKSESGFYEKYNQDFDW